MKVGRAFCSYFKVLSFRQTGHRLAGVIKGQVIDWQGCWAQRWVSCGDLQRSDHAPGCATYQYELHLCLNVILVLRRLTYTYHVCCCQ